MGSRSRRSPTGLSAKVYGYAELLELRQALAARDQRIAELLVEYRVSVELNHLVLDLLMSEKNPTEEQKLAEALTGLTSITRALLRDWLIDIAALVGREPPELSKSLRSAIDAFFAVYRQVLHHLLAFNRSIIVQEQVMVGRLEEKIEQLDQRVKQLEALEAARNQERARGERP